ncbi:TPA: hypothetical protein U0T47_001754 [Listeria monocytogenes]|nr:hypothetical protein [Listeria monocytogenes]
MTVAELIEELKQYDSNANVEICVGGESSDYQIVEYYAKTNKVSIFTT